jgi:hypothetical protein
VRGALSITFHTSKNGGQFTPLGSQVGTAIANNFGGGSGEGR